MCRPGVSQEHLDQIHVVAHLDFPELCEPWDDHLDLGTIHIPAADYQDIRVPELALYRFALPQPAAVYQLTVFQRHQYVVGVPYSPVYYGYAVQDHPTLGPNAGELPIPLQTLPSNGRVVEPALPSTAAGSLDAPE